MKVTADGHMVGEEFTAPAGKAPLIEAAIRRPTPSCASTWSRTANTSTPPSERPDSSSFRDNDAKPGKSYYYVRVFQRDTEKPDGFPEVGWTSPWYVTYQ